ncbi:unnamed protein product [Symbiodinium natans]|uniref:Polyketide synthase-like phosphopantetheine-binding domain-containing protein n=1 Tax=Symbiodinium natans TaxID=878477 RepID=A0A812ML66_9DINO|nr:unnamed protein product [Symbiodinium natans]
MDESLVPVVVRSLTGDILLELRMEDGTTLRQLAKKVRNLKGEGSWLGVAFMCDGELMANSSTIANVLANMEEAEQADLTAIVGETSLADVMHECSLVFLERAGLEVSEEDFLLEGLNSFGHLQLRDYLERHFDVSLAPTVMYDFPTLKQVSEHIHRILLQPGS